MRLLHMLASVNPRAGGVTEGVRNLGLRFIESGHEVEVVTLDDPIEDFVRQFPLTCHALGPSHGGYRYNRRLVPWLRTHARNYDAVIVNGLWQYPGLAAWMALRATDVPYYVFTHGMLDPWFKRTYPLKHLKKLIYWPWAEYRVLRDARAVLFTSEEEKTLARDSFWLYRANERVVSYGTSTPPQDARGLREHFLTKYSELRERRALLFLSRIHEKKGCDLLIKAFANVAKCDPKLHLIMAGPDPGGLITRLSALARDLAVTNRITWTGMLQDKLKWGAFYCAEVFILPSHQENFGIAVVESLGCGLPVLISDKINIWREVKADEAGFVESDTQEGTHKLLNRWLALDIQSRVKMSQRAHESFARRFNVDAMVKRIQAVLDETGR